MPTYSKAVAAAIGAGLTAAISFYPHAGWISIASAVCTLLATYAVPNVPQKSTALPPVPATAVSQDTQPWTPEWVPSPAPRYAYPDNRESVPATTSPDLFREMTFDERTRT